MYVNNKLDTPYFEVIRQLSKVDINNEVFAKNVQTPTNPFFHSVWNFC